MITTLQSALLSHIALLFLVLPCCSNSLNAQTSHPNVILILTDDMRFDFYSGAGHPYLKTPNIDRLAKEGTVFSRAYVATPLCGPNRASINTGLLSSQHGIRNHRSQSSIPFYPQGNFLPASIHSTVGGTAMIGKWFHSPNGTPRNEYDRWFVHFGSSGNPYYYRQWSIQGMTRDSMQAAAIAGSPTHYATDIEFHEAARWTGENASIQTFCFVSPYAPHSPANPAERHDGTYDGLEMPQRPNVMVSASELDQITANYNNRCEMMLAVDEGIGHLLSGLETNGVLEDSLIILTSDNGMMFGEHGRFFEKKVPFEEACRIPLIVRYGANLTGQGPVDPHQLVSHTDLMMTMVEMAGGSVPEAAKGTTYYGRSLASEWKGDSGQTDVRRRSDVIMLYYHNDSDDNTDDLDNDGMVWASIVTDDGWKYADVNLRIGKDVTKNQYNDITDGLEPMLFNLNKDPLEKQNLIGKCGYVGIRRELQDRLSTALRDNDAEFQFAAPKEVLGDVNKDSVFDLVDIMPFIALLWSGEYAIEADINEDCELNLLDIEPFVLLLLRDY